MTVENCSELRASDQVTNLHLSLLPGCIDRYRNLRFVTEVFFFVTAFCDSSPHMFDVITSSSKSRHWLYFVTSVVLPKRYRLMFVTELYIHYALYGSSHRLQFCMSQVTFPHRNAPVSVYHRIVLFVNASVTVNELRNSSPHWLGSDTIRTKFPFVQWTTRFPLEGLYQPCLFRR